MINLIQNTIGALGRRVSSAASIITANLQMWLDFANSEWVGGELVVKDKSPNTNNAKLFTGKALSFNGNDAVTDFGNPNVNLKSICFWVNLDTTTEQLFNLTSTQSIEVVSGVITLNGTWSNSNIYVDGVATTSIGTTPQRVIVTTDTNILVNDLEFAHIGTDFGSLDLADVQIYDTEFTLPDALIDYNNPNKLIFDVGGSIALADLKGYWALSEGAGSVAYDSSGQGNNGTITGATYVDKQYTIPQLGMMDWAKEMLFDGVNDYVQLATATLVGDFTIGFIYNTTSISGSFIGNATYSGIRYDRNQGDRITARFGSVNYYIVLSGGSLIKSYTNVTLTRAGTTLSVYLDGVLNTTITVVTSDWVFTNARIGSTAWAKFNGIISQSYMFSDALSASEVLDIYNTNTIPTTNLYGHWKNSGTETWLDLSTNSNNGTPVGSPSTVTLIENPNTVGFDVLGNALRLRENAFNLDGSGYAEVADDATLNISNGTLQFWLKTSDTKFNILSGQSTSEFIGKTDNGVWSFGNAGTVTSYIGSGTASTQPLYDGNWNFYTFTGVNVSTWTTHEITNLAGFQLDGLIDEVLIYDSILTTTEITNNYNVGLTAHS